VNGEVRFDYTTVGHVTADVMADGSRRAGGSAFYSALQAARLGQRVLIITRGAPREIEELLDPYRTELELEIRPARRTTTLQTSADGGGRTQRMLAWAGPIAGDLTIDTSILHLAPVARETPSRWRGRADFVGLTPQGLVRTWPTEGELPEEGAEISEVPLAPSLLPERCDAIVISETERESCAWLTSGTGSAGSIQAGTGEDIPLAEAASVVVAVTAEAAPTTIHLPGGAIARVEVPAIEHFRDDVGAGDVFAAAFFVALREGRSPQAAASLANAAAAVRIGGTGANAIGDRSAIEARLRAVA
jgi:1D-myo-inositol 3-kinase